MQDDDAAYCHIKQWGTVRDGPIINYQNHWQSTSEYQIGDIVTDRTNLYLSIVDHNQQSLTDIQAWRPLGNPIAHLPMIPPGATDANTLIPVYRSDLGQTFLMKLSDFHNIGAEISASLQQNHHRVGAKLTIYAHRSFLKRMTRKRFRLRWFGRLKWSSGPSKDSSKSHG